jgi:hypothetical protein
MAWILMALFFGSVAMLFLAIIWLFVRRPSLQQDLTNNLAICLIQRFFMTRMKLPPSRS